MAKPNDVGCQVSIDSRWDEEAGQVGQLTRVLNVAAERRRP